MICFLLGAVGGLLIRRQNFIPNFFTKLFLAFLAFFVFSSRHFESRHLSTVVLWYVVLLAFGIYIFWGFLESHRFFYGKFTRYSAAIIFIIATINFQHILYPLDYRDSIMIITGHYHPNLGPLDDYLLAHKQNNDVIISTNTYLRYAEWMGKPVFSKEYFFDISTTNETIQSIIDQHSSGWVVFDKIWVNQLQFPIFQAFLQNDSIEYVGSFGDEYLWHWKKK
jgi:hypothetical protein